MAVDTPRNISEVIALGSDILAHWSVWHGQYSGAEHYRIPSTEGLFGVIPLCRIRTEYEIFYRNGYALVFAHDRDLAVVFTNNHLASQRCLDAPLNANNKKGFIDNIYDQERILNIAQTQTEQHQRAETRGAALLRNLNRERTFRWWQVAISVLSLVAALAFGVVGIVITLW